VIERDAQQPCGLWEAVAARARTTPEQVLLVDEEGRRMTCQEVEQGGRRMASWLQRHGLHPGDRVAWVMQTSLQAALLAIGASRAGLVQVPVVPISRQRELNHILRQTRAKALIVADSWRTADGEEIARPVVRSMPDVQLYEFVPDFLLDPGEPAEDPPVALTPAPDAERWIFYTSGSSTEPKGCRHSDHHLWHAGYGLAAHQRLDERDCVPIVFPITHIGGICLLFTALLSGCRLLYVRQFGPDAIEAMRRAEVTVAGSGMPFFTQYLDAQQRLPEGERLFPAVRAFTSGGMTKPLHINRLMKEQLGAEVLGSYGLTEAPILAVARPGQSDRELSESEGPPTPGVTVKVVAADGAVAGVRVEGEIRIKAPQMMFGYLLPEQEATAWDDEGFLHTGDVGLIDEHGNVVITGRLKDVVIRKGENVSAREVEELLGSHPEVRDVAVIGVPDEETGERVGAVVVAAAREPSLEDLCGYLRAKGLAERKLPERLFLVDAIPRDPSGKIMKRSLSTRLLPEAVR
jgi:acyl-CoA synthetase (AMP-forming)/AMP-acid ligase II